MILESLSNFGLLKLGIDNIEAQMYVNNATHEITDERLRFLDEDS